MKRKAFLLLSLVLLLSFSVMGAAAQTNDNIVDIAAQNNNFDTLHSAIVAAGLADTLASADAQYTVFAPTDAAFGNFGGANPDLLAAAHDFLLLGHFWLQRVEAHPHAEDACTIYSERERADVWDSFSADTGFNNDGSTSLAGHQAADEQSTTRW